MKKNTLFLIAIMLFVACKKDNNKLAPTLSFTVNARALGDPDYTISPPTSNSTGAFTYTSSNSSVATINGSTVSIKGVGTTTITATQSASGDYSDGAVSQTLNVVPAGTYVLGQAIPGGIVFYINGTGVHGFMISDVDLSVGLPWSSGSIAVTNATLNTLGGGLSNTNAVIASLGTGTYAAQACKNFNGGGFTDWYLPDQLELTYVRQKKDLIGLPNSNYWSSTEVSGTPANAVYVYMGPGTLTSITTGSVTTISVTIYTYSKLYNYSVRAIRAF